MEIAFRRIPQGRALTILLLASVFCTGALVSSSPSPNTCGIRKLEAIIPVQENKCYLKDDGFDHHWRLSGASVLETNGTTVDKALNLLQTRDSMHAAVLLYAKWCPFSRELRPVLESLSTAYPSVYHFAVEESNLPPSGYSYFGVHSFPALFLHNKTGRVRYHGARTFKAISEYYKDFTGMEPLDLSQSDFNGGEPKSEESFKINGTGLHDDIYLMLSVIFLSLRIVSYMLPRVCTLVKNYWTSKERSLRQSQINLLQRVVFRRSDQDHQTSGSSRRPKGKSPMKDLTQETGKVLLSVPGWPSSHLALGEGSSSRPAAKEDSRG